MQHVTRNAVIERAAYGRKRKVSRPHLDEILVFSSDAFWHAHLLDQRPSVEQTECHGDTAQIREVGIVRNDEHRLRDSR